jgi:hypothetical protein
MDTTIKPVAYLLVGIPCTAQLSWSAPYLLQKKFVHLAPDALVESEIKAEEKTFGDVIRANIDAASHWFNDRVKSMIDMYRHLIWDRANLTLTTRRPKIDLLIAAGYDVVAVAFEIPAAVTKDLGKEYVRPTRLEGFSKIIIVTPTEEYVAEA